ncbi:serpin family protein [Turkeypox virus]|uniref:Serpin family protein n=1 Tax=Turkeypox virus TaxID=336486 RepID=A0A0M5I212_9POXV|nr:serpin family protein [Turkeypox virus]ALA62395.1 serpin family protein [Turkeypox virus]
MFSATNGISYNRSTNIQLDLAIKIYKCARHLGIENIIIEPCSILSILGIISKITDNLTASKIYDFLELTDCVDIDAYMKSISNINSDVVDYYNKLVIKDSSVDKRTQKVLCERYNTMLVNEYMSPYNISAHNSTGFSIPWNREFATAPEEQIRKRHDAVEIVSMLVDSKRRTHLLRRLDDFKASVVRTSLGNNGYILTTITPDIDDEKLFSNIEDNISTSNILRWIDNTKMKRAQHRFKIPEVTIDAKYDLISILRAAGLDLSLIRFSNLLPETRLYLNKMTQSNTMSISSTKLSIQSTTDSGFRINSFPNIDCCSCSEIATGKPFIFLIQCRKTNNFLYFGSIRDSF